MRWTTRLLLATSMVACGTAAWCQTQEIQEKTQADFMRLPVLVLDLVAEQAGVEQSLRLRRGNIDRLAGDDADHLGDDDVLR